MDVEEMVALLRTSVGSDDDPGSGLTAVAQLRQQLDRLEVIQVRRARNRGLTWQQIAAILGVSRQAVHKKYGGSIVGRRK